MKFGVYSIRDAKTGFLTPTIDHNDQSAIRNFAHACMQVSSLFYSHPQDYDLWKIAEFDSDSGLLSPITITHLYSATDVD